MNWAAVIVALVCITTVLLFALSQGIDGMALAGGLTIIGGLGGYTAHGLINKT